MIRNVMAIGLAMMKNAIVIGLELIINVMVIGLAMTKVALVIGEDLAEIGVEQEETESRMVVVPKWNFQFFLHSAIQIWAIGWLS